MTKLLLHCSRLLLLCSAATAFIAQKFPLVATRSPTTTLQRMVMMDPATSSISSISDLSSSITSSGMMLAETEAWVQPAITFLDPFLNIMSFFMLCRVVFSWYPEIKLNEMPYLLVAVPTQGLLRAVRDLIPPAFGVDITPIFWLAIFTFIHEILLGQQGLLTLKLKYGI